MRCLRLKTSTACSRSEARGPGRRGAEPRCLPALRKRSAGFGSSQGMPPTKLLVSSLLISVSLTPTWRQPDFGQARCRATSSKRTLRWSTLRRSCTGLCSQTCRHLIQVDSIITLSSKSLNDVSSCHVTRSPPPKESGCRRSCRRHTRPAAASKARA